MTKADTAARPTLELEKKIERSRGHWTEDDQGCIPNLTDMERDIILAALRRGPQVNADGELKDGR